MSDPAICPTCNMRLPDKTADGVAPPSRPFCSNRCKLVDLSRWLGEEYRVAGPPVGDGFAPDDDLEDSHEA